MVQRYDSLYAVLFNNSPELCQRIGTGWFRHKESSLSSIILKEETIIPESILYKSIADRFRPARVADGPVTARYIFIKNASWDVSKYKHDLAKLYTYLYQNKISDIR